MEQVRCFIAIELPKEVKSALSMLQSRLKSGGQYPAKWVNPYSIHLTLKFLGSVAADRLGEITRAIEEAARGVPPLRLEVKGLGVFPNPRRVQVIWVGIGGDVEQLNQFQQRLEANLAPLGFPPEKRSFTPHLTLARVRENATAEERQGLGQLITSTGFEANHEIYVNAISLMKSQLTREGAIYSQISATKLRL
jgi:2'-5' RNA ligase